MFLLYWEVYVLMDLVVNLWNEDLHWFRGKKTFIDGGVYVRFSGGVGSLLFTILLIVISLLLKKKKKKREREKSAIYRWLFCLLSFSY